MRSAETFGTMLRRFRTSAGLSQERLAERSGISTNGIAALEAGRRTSPRLNTVSLLCDALKLGDDDRSALIATVVQTGITTTRAPTESRAVHPLKPSAKGREPESGFVGRLVERETLREAWQRRSRIALLFGEAGVGKTSLAEEFANERANDNVRVLRGRSTQQQLGVFEAFVDPVRSAVGQFQDGIPPNLRELGRLVPGILDGLSDPLVPSRADPAVARRLLFETVKTLFVSCGPTVLVLDDLQWADPGTLSLLSFMAIQPELSDLMIIGTVRSTDVDPSTSAMLAELRRHCDLTSIHLSGLSQSELVELVSTVAGASVSNALIATVSNATNGNPLYTKELTEHLLHDNGGSTGAAAVPHGIRQTIEFRVAGLSPDAQLLLRGGAALGQSFDLALAGEIVGLIGEALLVAVEDALLSGLLVEQRANLASFSHGLVATTVYEATSKTRRVALHRSAATILTERVPTLSAEIVMLALHWALVAEADPRVRATAAQWSVRAGDAAAASAAVDEAINCYRRAASLCEGPTIEHADALVRLGSALAANGNVIDGNEHLERGLDFADTAGEAAVFARAALGLAASVRYTQSDARRIAQLELAADKLGPDERILRPAVLATLRRQLGFVDTPEADRIRTEAATEVASVVLDPNVSEELLISLGSLRDSLVLDDPVPLGQLAAKIIRVATHRQDLPVLSTGLYRQAWAAMELGDRSTLHQAVSEYRRIAKQLRRPYELALGANMAAAIAQMEGRYADAEADGQEALAHAATIEDGNFSWVYFANAGIRAIDQGQVVPTFEVMRSARADFGGLATFEAALAASAAIAGETAFADDLLACQVGSRGETIERNWSYLSAERLPVLGMLAWCCGATANVEQAKVLQGFLGRVAQTGVRVVRVAALGAWLGPLDHHIGVLNRVLGDLDGAEENLTRALVVEDDMRGRPFRVRTLLELAEVLKLRREPDAALRSASFQKQAEDLAHELGLETILTSGSG